MIINSRIKKIRNGILLIVILLLIGVFGFMLIEDLNFLDSFYMTIITISTVGFGEVHELSDIGKLFTSILIIFSLGLFAYSLSTITTLILEGEIQNYFKDQRIKTEINKMENHTIVCGLGRNGHQAATELKAHGHPFVIIDKDHQVIEHCEEESFYFIEGDASHDDVLIKAGIETAKAIITTLPDDASNLFVVITARSIKPDILIVSRASEETSCKKLHIAGVDNVVMPEKVGGAHMATLVLKPDVVEFLDRIAVQDNMTNLEEIICNNLPPIFKNKSLYDLDIRRRTGANIVGYKTPEGEFVINPNPEIKMISNSKLFVLGTPEQINKIKDIFINN